MIPPSKDPVVQAPDEDADPPRSRADEERNGSANAHAAADFVVLANRLPVRRVAGRHGGWRTSPGGLVSALVPVLRRRAGAWIGWAGVNGDEPRPFEHGGLWNVPLSLSKEEAQAYYEGFANSTLWPLYHDAIRAPELRSDWWRAYVEVNRRFAARAAELAAEGARVWVHDYHLQLVPSMLRRARPDLRIGFFLHTPLPPEELFARLPWRRELVEGLLGADLVGFQTESSARNFARLAERFSQAQRAERSLLLDGRRVRYGAFPISIDFQRFEELAKNQRIQQGAGDLRRAIGPARRILLGVDRLDYSKGIDARLRAWRLLLRQRRVRRKDCVLVQTVVPSREHVAGYAELRRTIDRLVGEIGGEFGEIGGSPVHYLRRNLAVEDLVSLYLAADVMLVTPLRDGMNLIAKEYVAARVDETGVLVLSEHAGAAVELTEAVPVNPFDLEGLADGIARAVHMPDDEAARRMRALRATVRERDVYRWAEDFLRALDGARALEAPVRRRAGGPGAPAVLPH